MEEGPVDRAIVDEEDTDAVTGLLGVLRGVLLLEVIAEDEDVLEAGEPDVA